LVDIGGNCMLIWKHYVIGIFVRAVTGLTILMGFLVVIPLTLWFAWARHSPIAYSIAQSVFCLSFAWGLISLFQLQRSLRKLGLSPEGSTQLFSMKSPPEDPDEFCAWRWGWQFMYAILAVLLCMIAMPVAYWLAER
jgi:hypothetical protein